MILCVKYAVHHCLRTIKTRGALVQGDASEIGLPNREVIATSVQRIYDCGAGQKDRQILMALQNDARLSFSALGKEIGLSQPAMSERVKKLEDAGVIAGYAARIDLAAVGLRLQVVVRVRTTHEHIQRYIQILPDLARGVGRSAL